MSATGFVPDPRTTETQLRALRQRIAQSRPGDSALRTMLVLGHEVVRQRQLLADAGITAPRLEPTVAPSAANITDYPGLIEHVTTVVRGIVPDGASLLVVSRGDDRLMVPGYAAHHFPQDANGQYAGHYPADGDSAVSHLDACCEGGAEYLLIPATSFWWLDYYGELASRLLARGRVVHHDDRCLLFRLYRPHQGETE
jgi:hypothetical protein